MQIERISDLPGDVREDLAKSDQNAWRRAFNKAVRAGCSTKKATAAAWQAVGKEGPTVGAVHVDGVSWSTRTRKPKRRAVAKGRILKSEDVRRYTLGVVYEPDVEDTQGDMASAEEIEKACWDFNRRRIGTGKELAKRNVRKGALGIQHNSWDDGHGEIIESYIAPADFELETPHGPEQVKKGTWLMGVIWSPENWAKIQNGELTGLSLGGRARREDA